MDIQDLEKFGQSLIDLVKDKQTYHNRFRQLEKWACVMVFQLRYNLNKHDIKLYQAYVLDAFERGLITFSYTSLNYEITALVDGGGLEQLDSPDAFMTFYQSKQHKK
jgi:hypothetical protein